MAVMSPDRIKGAADVGPYEAQWQAGRRSVPVRSTAPEPLPQRPACGSYARGRQPCRQQWRGWRPTGLAPPPNPARSQESKSRVQPAPLRGLGALAVPEQAAGVTGLAPAALHSPPTVMGMGSLLGSWCGGTGARAPDA
jgi:hypothetical protein